MIVLIIKSLLIKVNRYQFQLITNRVYRKTALVSSIMSLKQQIKNGFLSFTKKNRSNNVEEKSNCSRNGETKKTRASGSGMLQLSSQSSTSSTPSDWESLNSLSNHGSTTNHKTSQSQRKRVRFNYDMTQWNMVESYLQYSSDLWWSKDEMRQRRIDMSSKTLMEYRSEEICQIKQYANTYHSARQQLIVSNHPPQEGHTKARISILSDEYKIIVRGKSKGWVGLERQTKLSSCSNCDTTKILNSQTIVKQIVQAYAEMTFRHNIHPNDSARMLRALSRSLTSVDRSWAVIMGNADRDALLSQ
jgi:hypothetical protein